MTGGQPRLPAQGLKRAYFVGNTRACIEGPRLDSIHQWVGGLALMEPEQEAQPALFYEFSLEDHVPQLHQLRSIDRFVDLTGISTYLADFYSATGHPSVDPELLNRMQFRLPLVTSPRWSLIHIERLQVGFGYSGSPSDASAPGAGPRSVPSDIQQFRCISSQSCRSD